MRNFTFKLSLLFLCILAFFGIASASTNEGGKMYTKSLELKDVRHKPNRPMKPENMQLTIEYDNRDIRLLISEDTEFAQLSISRGPLAEYTTVVYDSSQIISIPECFVGIYTVNICVDGEYFYETELLFR